MNKRVEKCSVKYDDKEDLEIKKIANSKKNDPMHHFLLIVLIILFILTLFISVSYIITYNNKNSSNNREIIEIKTNNANVSIINNGLISKKIKKESFSENKEIIVENINVIELIPTNGTEENIVNYNIKYNITKNDFLLNTIPTNNSEVLVRFSYSYDKEEWTYINNVISTTNSNISPLIGNNYDISGMLTTLSVATNVELKTEGKNNKKIYWRSETIFKNIKDNIDTKELNANFIIEYKSN